MEINELKQEITEHNAWEDLHELVRDEWRGVFLELQFESILSERVSGSGDYDGWQYVFRLGDKLYTAFGTYSPWNGVDFEIGDLKSFKECKEVKITKIEYREV